MGVCVCVVHDKNVAALLHNCNCGGALYAHVDLLTEADNPLHSPPLSLSRFRARKRREVCTAGPTR